MKIARVIFHKLIYCLTAVLNYFIFPLMILVHYKSDRNSQIDTVLQKAEYIAFSRCIWLVVLVRSRLVVLISSRLVVRVAGHGERLAIISSPPLFV